MAAGSAFAQPAPSPPPPQPSPDSAAAEKHARGRQLARAWRADKDTTKLDEAARLFKEAFQLTGSPLYECDLGLALHYLGEDARAHARLTSCMTRLAAVSPDKVAGYRGVDDEVATAVSTGHVAVDVATQPPGAIISVSSFPSDETMLAPTLVWLRPGTHTFTAHVDGHVDVNWTVEVSEADAAARARKEWRVKLDPTPVNLGGGGGDGGGGGGGGGDGEPPPLVDRPAPRSKTVAYATLASGAALVAGGGVLHYLGRDARADLEGLPAGDEYDRKVDRWHAYQRGTIGLYAAGAITTGVGVWLYLRTRTPAPLAVTPTPEGRGAMVWLLSTSR